MDQMNFILINLKSA